MISFLFLFVVCDLCYLYMLYVPMYLQHPGKNLTCVTVRICFREVWGDVWRYFWTIFGDHVGTHLRGFGEDFEMCIDSFSYDLEYSGW